MITQYHAKYYAHELTLQHASNGVDRLSQSLFDASVDLNPHQIEAALFALRNPLNKGVILAYEVGLGKTIEAALVLSQCWAERKRHLLIVCPASLRRQWASELQEKFNLPSQILDAPTVRKFRKNGVFSPLSMKKVTIMSYHYAARLEEELLAVPWDLVVIDEAHKLRNAHRPKNKMGQALKRALAGRQKLLLTATPLQNSLIELYGLSTVIDEHLFGDDKAFRKQYMSSESGLPELRERLDGFVHRTLRKHVLEYIPYTKRKTITQPFNPTDEEQDLYNAISAFLQKDESYALPKKNRHLISLILRKLLASSSHAVVNTLQVIKQRIELIRDEKLTHDDFIEKLIEDDALESEYLEDEYLEGDEFSFFEEEDNEATKDVEKINCEIAEISLLIEKANNIKQDSKAKALLQALEVGFNRMAEMGAPKKVVLFTESRRTQEYLESFLSVHGFANKLVTFSGTNNTPQAQAIYQSWKETYKDSDHITGSAQIDKRSALIDFFKSDAEIMIATEAAAEGINLQFCSLIINYDLPWNPQRVEQRIGRCHRYGQKHDVVVINFLNKRNEADKRVLELLTDKFNLFDGVFGASDDVLGRIESGIDFEKRILEIYDTCRLPDEISSAFSQLQSDLEGNINEKMLKTQQLLIENFDEDVHDLLKSQLDQAEKRLDKVARWFWLLSKFQLSAYADFNDKAYSFELHKQPQSSLMESHESPPLGRYELIQKGKDSTIHAHTYRMNHPLGEFVIDTGKQLQVSHGQIVFDYSNHPTKISAVEQLQHKSGWLTLSKLMIDSFQREEHLIFTAMDDEGVVLDQEVCEKLFSCFGETCECNQTDGFAKLETSKQRQIEAKISEVLEANNTHFQAERDRLERWADDKIAGAEQALLDTKAKIRTLKRESRQAQTLDEQKTIQESIKLEERKQRRQRQDIFDVEDEIFLKRDALIDALEKRLNQHTTVDELFSIRWSVT